MEAELARKEIQIQTEDGTAKAVEFQPEKGRTAGEQPGVILYMADRIIVFRSGRITAQMPRASFDREAILLAAAHAAHDGSRAA